MVLKITDSAILNKLSETLDKTGLVLPSIVVFLLAITILSQVYHDRAIFTHKHRDGVYVPPGHPLVGNTIRLIKDGVEGQHERGVKVRIET